MFISRHQGATCYLNTAVQALFMTPPFRARVSELGAAGAATGAALLRMLSGRVLLWMLRWLLLRMLRMLRMLLLVVGAPLWAPTHGRPL